MPEWCWLNGQVMPLCDARVGVEDRGFQFADGVYEAIRLYDGKPFALDLHIRRLEKSLNGIEMPLPLERQKLISEIWKLVQQSGLSDGLVYLQITRGPSARNHIFPRELKPTVLFYVRELPPLPPIDQVKPYTLCSVEDQRWNKCWIKSIALLENVLARNAAVAKRADEAIFVHQGHVTEGSASNLFMVNRGRLITHPLGPKVLAGVTRELLLEIATSIGIAVEERAMKLEDALRCDEVFMTSSTRELTWASQWDGHQIGSGLCGPVTLKLHEEYRRRVNLAMG